MKYLTALLFFLHVRLYSGEWCDCPNGWTYFESSCYHLANEVSAKWTDADHYCKSHRSNLVKINNKDEDVFVQKLCKKTFRTGLIEDDSVWTGATDDVIEDIWEWNVDGSLLSYVNWDIGQPDSLNGRNQDCMSLYSLNNFTWHDSGCEALFHPLCEIVKGWNA